MIQPQDITDAFRYILWLYFFCPFPFLVNPSVILGRNSVEIGFIHEISRNEGKFLSILNGINRD